jgi:hypothetical protein
MGWLPRVAYRWVSWPKTPKAYRWGGLLVGMVIGDIEWLGVFKGRVGHQLLEKCFSVFSGGFFFYPNYPVSRWMGNTLSLIDCTVLSIFFKNILNIRICSDGNISFGNLEDNGSSLFCGLLLERGYSPFWGVAFFGLTHFTPSQIQWLPEKAIPQNGEYHLNVYKSLI